ncbi:hypothetical protein NC653_017617 [Populus alba x Populus x berolinensis]|uniref:Uncharacterized protein n=1 Tax=Populus alba x Populus x berolinensis TaxID=444605 RepID=A0AAD6QR28_9ROSI|nr:hypothetical protein NC653_017617 [Populus alba x Populus x berolinensis]
MLSNLRITLSHQLPPPPHFSASLSFYFYFHFTLRLTPPSPPFSVSLSLYSLAGEKSKQNKLVVVGSTETESDEEDYLAELTHQMAHSTLEDDFKRNDLPCSTKKTKVGFCLDCLHQHYVQLDAGVVVDKDLAVEARMGLHL